MRLEGLVGRAGGYDGCGGREGVACYKHVLIGGAAAFGGYDVEVVGGRYFVDYADETLVPAGFVVVPRTCLFWI